MDCQLQTSQQLVTTRPYHPDGYAKHRYGAKPGHCTLDILLSML